MERDTGITPAADHNANMAAAEKDGERHKEQPAEGMDARHRRIALNAQKKAISALAQLAPEDMTANEARQLLKTAQDIERRITEGHRDPERQRDEVQRLLASVWEAAKRG